MRLWCNIQSGTRPLCTQIFGATIGSGVPSWRCLVFVGQAPGNGIFMLDQAPPYNYVKACMRFRLNILGVTRPLCSQIFGAIGSGVPSWRRLVYVRSGAKESEFQIEQAPPLTIARWACMRF